MTILKEQQKYYHVSRKGRLSDSDTIVLNPIIPKTAMTGEETKTPRICVCENPADAAMASDGGMSSTYAVYELIQQIPVYTPTEKEVPDVKKTHERWIRTSAKFKFIGLFSTFKTNSRVIFKNSKITLFKE